MSHPKPNPNNEAEYARFLLVVGPCRAVGKWWEDHAKEYRAQRKIARKFFNEYWEPKFGVDQWESFCRGFRKWREENRDRS